MMKGVRVRLLSVFLCVFWIFNVSWGEIHIIRKFKIPDFNSRASLDFTDICFDTRTQKLAVCSDGGYGEFPFKQGKVIFNPPGFIAETGSYVIRAYFMANGTLNAVDTKNRIVFWGKQKLSFPDQVFGDITGAAFHKNTLILSTASGYLYRLSVNGNALRFLSTEKVLDKGIEGISVYKDHVWVTDGLGLYMIEKESLIPQGNLPVIIKGFCFMNNTLFAVTAGYRHILQMRLK